MRASGPKMVFSGAAQNANKAAGAGYFADSSGESTDRGTRWRSGWDSNPRYPLAEENAWRCQGIEYCTGTWMLIDGLDSLLTAWKVVRKFAAIRASSPASTSLPCDEPSADRLPKNPSDASVGTIALVRTRSSRGPAR